MVPASFEDFGIAINTVYAKLVEEGTIKVKEEPPVPTIPVDYDWARKLGLIRKPSAFVSSIVDERGDELVYAVSPSLNPQPLPVLRPFLPAAAPSTLLLTLCWVVVDAAQGMKISEVFKSNLGVGGVVGLIWFRKRLPDYFCRFIELVLMVTADHGPAVAGESRFMCCPGSPSGAVLVCCLDLPLTVC